MATTSANMGLSIPQTGDTSYPTSVTDSMTLIDAHDHTSGKGVQIPTGGIADLAVSTAKLAAGAVTQAKRASLGQQVSSSSGSYSSTSTSYADVTNLTVSITTTGRPVFIGLISDGSISKMGMEDNGGSTQSVSVKIVRGSTDIAIYNLRSEATTGVIYIPSSSIYMIDVPSAGTYTYKVQGISSAFSGSAPTLVVQSAKLVAYEL